ncbi:MAG TPA: response regulator [Mucilaginibacter sp.]|nr:response regulator [Mucilaginibacter sp.]
MKKRILVIDDDEDILEVLKIILQDEGYQVILSNTGAEAENIPSLKPDLVLLDLRLAGSKKDGAQICMDIKSGNEVKHVPVMLISAEPDIRHIADRCGANAYVQKPFDIDHFLNQVKEYVA